MKKLLILLVSLITINGICQNKKTTWDYDELKGNVKNLQTKSFSVKTTNGKICINQIVNDYYSFTSIEYNEKGDWISYRSYNPDSSNRWAENPIYDKNGILTERNDFLYTNSDSTLDSHYSYKYDIFGNVTESVKIKVNSSIVSKSIYKYDKYGNNIEYLLYNSDTLKLRMLNIYDNRNNLIEVKTFNSESNAQVKKTVFTINSNGNIAEEVDWKNDFIDGTTKFEYDKYGFKTKICKYKADNTLDKITNYTYKYDMKGNWIEKTQLNDNVATKITKRQFEYYR